jgi:hypothetical protein
MLAAPGVGLAEQARLANAGLGRHPPPGGS